MSPIDPHVSRNYDAPLVNWASQQAREAASQSKLVAESPFQDTKIKFEANPKSPQTTAQSKKSVPKDASQLGIAKSNVKKLTKTVGVISNPAIKDKVDKAHNNVLRTNATNQYLEAFSESADKTQKAHKFHNRATLQLKRLKHGQDYVQTLHQFEEKLAQTATPMTRGDLNQAMLEARKHDGECGFMTYKLKSEIEKIISQDGYRLSDGVDYDKEISDTQRQQIKDAIHNHREEQTKKIFNGTKQLVSDITKLAKAAYKGVDANHCQGKKAASAFVKQINEDLKQNAHPDTIDGNVARMKSLKDKMHYAKYNTNGFFNQQPKQLEAHKKTLQRERDNMHETELFSIIDRRYQNMEKLQAQDVAKKQMREYLDNPEYRESIDLTPTYKGNQSSAPLVFAKNYMAQMQNEFRQHGRHTHVVSDVKDALEQFSASFMSDTKDMSPAELHNHLLKKKVEISDLAKTSMLEDMGVESMFDEMIDTLANKKSVTQSDLTEMRNKVTKEFIPGLEKRARKLTENFIDALEDNMPKPSEDAYSQATNSVLTNYASSVSRLKRQFKECKNVSQLRSFYQDDARLKGFMKSQQSEINRVLTNQWDEQFQILDAATKTNHNIRFVGSEGAIGSKLWHVDRYDKWEAAFNNVAAKLDDDNYREVSLQGIVAVAREESKYWDADMRPKFKELEDIAAKTQIPADERKQLIKNKIKEILAEKLNNIRDVVDQSFAGAKQMCDEIWQVTLPKGSKGVDAMDRGRQEHQKFFVDRNRAFQYDPNKKVPAAKQEIDHMIRELNALKDHFRTQFGDHQKTQDEIENSSKKIADRANLVQGNLNLALEGVVVQMKAAHAKK